LETLLQLAATFPTLLETFLQPAATFPTLLETFLQSCGDFSHSVGDFTATFLQHFSFSERLFCNLAAIFFVQ
jgi:hypothetical protein